MNCIYATLRLAILSAFAIVLAQSGAVSINSQNYDSYLGSNELVFINFYANWCRFSQMLEPIYDEFADKISKEFPAGKLAVAKIDCDTETALSTKNHINKYPTLKLFRYGVALKKEFRGARNVEAFSNYIREQLVDPVKVVHNIHELQSVEYKKRTLVGFFDDTTSPNYQTFVKLASVLRDSCSFVAAVNTGNAQGTSNKVYFRDTGIQLNFGEPYPENDLVNYEVLYAWANDKCTPVVREITFENAEELTEEGLPFLILFHKPDDQLSVKVFETEVVRQLVHEKSTINAVHADGLKFSHPLHHLGKSAADLPILAIDSFRHMYLFPDFKKISEGNQLNQFVQDLNSGKLHREFHNGPDPTQAPEIQLVIGNQPQHIPKADDDSNKQKLSTPPESVFIKLAPSRDRYSLKHGDGGEL